MSRKSTFNPIHESPSAGGGTTSEYLAMDGDFKRISSDMYRLSLQKESLDNQIQPKNIDTNEQLTDMLMARPMSHTYKSRDAAHAHSVGAGKQMRRFKSNRPGAMGPSAYFRA